MDRERKRRREKKEDQVEDSRQPGLTSGAPDLTGPVLLGFPRSSSLRESARLALGFLGFSHWSSPVTTHYDAEH